MVLLAYGCLAIGATAGFLLAAIFSCRAKISGIRGDSVAQQVDHVPRRALRLARTSKLPPKNRPEWCNHGARKETAPRRETLRERLGMTGCRSFADQLRSYANFVQEREFSGRKPAATVWDYVSIARLDHAVKHILIVLGIMLAWALRYDQGGSRRVA